MCNYNLITKITRDPKIVYKQPIETQLTILITGIDLVSRPWYRGFIVSKQTVIDTCVSDTYDRVRRSEIYFCGMYLLTSRLPVQRKALWPLN